MTKFITYRKYSFFSSCFFFIPPCAANACPSSEVPAPQGVTGTPFAAQIRTISCTSASERANVRIGDSVAVFAQGPIGLCAAAGAKMSGASLVIGVDKVPARLEMAKRMGADVVNMSVKSSDRKSVV